MESAAERVLRSFNSSYFLKEFTFLPKKIQDAEGESTFSDGFIWLRDYMIIWEYKERELLRQAPTPDAQGKWFQRKVLRKAKDQIKGDKDFFGKYGGKNFENLQGQTIEIDLDSVKETHYLIIYASRYPLPQDCVNQKYYTTREDRQFIHLMHATNWIPLCNSLLTPMEIIEYLRFRKEYLTIILDSSLQSEKSLLGRFIRSDRVPDLRFDTKQRNYEWVVDKMERKPVKAFDSLMKQLPKILTGMGETETSYLEMLIEFALLGRKQRENFVAHLENAILKSLYDDYKPHNCLTFLNTNLAGFVFLSNPIDQPQEEIIPLLEQTTLAYKYDDKLTIAIGINIRAESKYSILADWYYTRGPWKPNPEQERLVKKLYDEGWFNKAKTIGVPRYRVGFD